MPRTDEAVEEEQPLPGVLEEFRVALRDEIDAARRSSMSSAVPLVNGRRIAQVGDAYQYLFSVESMLQVPEDSPGDLHVPGQPPAEATIVSVDGMAITISVPKFFGDFVPRASLQTNLVYLLRKLIERIEACAERENPAGDRLLGLAPVNGVAAVAPETELDESQTAAVCSALGRDTTFIWGPPGTGKTRTIGTIGVELIRSNRSMLLVSHTNSAVDQAILHIADALGENLVDGSVLRLGEPKDQRLLERPRLIAKTHIEERSAELTRRKKELETERDVQVERVLELEKELGLVEWVAAAASDINRYRMDLEDLRQAEEARDKAREVLVGLRAEQPHVETMRADAEEAIVTLKPVPQLEDQVASLKKRTSELTRELAQAEEFSNAAVALLRETQETPALMRRWRKLPKPQDQQAEVSRAAAHGAELRDALREIATELDEVEGRLGQLRLVLESFRGRYQMTPEEAVSRSAALAEQITLREADEVQQRLRCGRLRAGLQRSVQEALGILREFDLTEVQDGSLEDLIDELKRVHEAAVVRTQGKDPTGLRDELGLINASISRIDQEIASIEEALREVEKLVVRDATVIATTLTRAYLRDSVQQRRFDTVILDEASMAPIPALWVAASLAERNAVAVGDFRQLPPIKHSEHEFAKLWLGRDIFEASGVKDRDDRGEPPDHLVQLTVQYRMHPDISEIPNRFIYKGRLRNGRDPWDESGLGGWYDSDWGQDSPVLLVNTESAHAWVTSVNGAGRSSRLNFLSATVCMDLVELMLRPDRLKPEVGARQRVLIGTPYRPHARLLNLLIRHQGVEGEVVAGTAHTFQGNEAPIMIFDLVNDEPHWRVGVFNPAFDEMNARLLNVALTRPQHRLVIVGDFDWIQRNGRRAFLGRLITWLREKHPVVDAVDLLPAGLAGRSARAQSSSSRSVNIPSGVHVVVDQDEFYQHLSRDLSAAKTRVVMHSPFITGDRLGMIGPHLQAAAERGVPVYVITKTREERSQRDRAVYAALENALLDWDVVVIHKHHMHEKLVFIDDEIVWTGSLNPLSFSNTQEVMERRASRELVKEYARVLRLEDLLGVYDSGQGDCPICGSELVPAEGRDEPFYWRCVEDDCYTRGIDQPPPRNGQIVCANCGQGVSFGFWGDEPRWRCKANPRHRQRIARTHLRLPKMRDLVPKRELRRLEKRFGTASGTSK